LPKRHISTADGGGEETTGPRAKTQGFRFAKKSGSAAPAKVLAARRKKGRHRSRLSSPGRLEFPRERADGAAR